MKTQTPTTPGSSEKSEEVPYSVLWKTEMIQLLTERMRPLVPPPGYSGIGPQTSTAFQTIKQVEVIVVEKLDETNTPSSIKPPPDQIAPYLEDTWPVVPPSKTSRAISKMRKATSFS